METIRGLALVLMVAGHVIGSTGELGMRVADDSALRYFYEALADVRMPLFIAISGFVYAMRPVQAGAPLGAFVQGKCRRILLPLFTVGSLFFVAQMLAPGINSDFAWSDFFELQLFGYMHFWFLQAIFWIFVVAAVLDRAGRMATPRQVAWVGLIAAGCSLNQTLFPEFMSLDGAAWLFVFFVAGLAIYRFADLLVSQPGSRWVVLAFVLLFLLSQLEQLGWIDLLPSADGVLATALGLSAVYVLIVYRFRVALLAWLGQYAYEVYLFHVFGTAATRIALAKFGVREAWIVFVASMVIGLLWPIVLKKAVGGLRWLNLVLFGTGSRSAN
ncbi:acyltransferase [Pseudorhodoferax sp.]|uniref:acyltransferase n=1 Tax=Pseudorhodoferax sp. TaxID=1993553 RepID=UPI002DD688B9|nr:acyltransferase [Pseudorhodoferax sp.]